MKTKSITANRASLMHRPNDRTLKTYVAEYMNGKSRRITAWNYTEAVIEASRYGGAIADITEL